jgi:CrcB protein
MIAMLRNILFVAFGGSIGSVFRYLTTVLIPTKEIPVATFSVNILGSFLIGFLMGVILKQANTQTWQLLLVTGFCGGFTTFSAFSWDIIVMFQQQRYIIALIYIITTILLGLVFTFLGFWISK